VLEAVLAAECGWHVAGMQGAMQGKKKARISVNNNDGD
jgi:hypothetical protein